MVYPITELPVKVELQLDGVWTDVTGYVRVADKIQVTRGRRNEGGTFEPGECSMVWNNQGGRFSPRNPTGPYYGAFGRNTPLRVSALLGSVRLINTTVSGTDDVTTPDSAGLSITGDIDLRVDASLPNWGRANGGSLLTKSLNAGQKAYRIGYTGAGGIFIAWTPDGTTEIFAESTVPLPVQTGRQAIRTTLDVDNGAGGKTATFYSAPSLAGPWTTLGAPVTTAGTTSIFNGTDILAVRGETAIHYGAEVYQGIAGTVRANPDFTAQAEGATSFADVAGNTWTLTGASELTARRYRFHGEVPSWPQQWDLSERDAWVAIQAAGVLRRLGQGTAALKSAIQRFVLRSTPAAYGCWPMEDAQDSTSVASGLPSGAAMTFSGSPRFAADDTIESSGPLPEMGLAAFTGAVTPYAATGTIYAHLLLAVPQGGDATGVLLRMYTTGTAARWDLTYTAGGGGGSLTLQAFDSAGVQILTSGALGYQVEGVPASIRLQLVQNGANIDWELGPASYVAGAGTFGGPTAATLNTRTVGAATTVQVNPGSTLDQAVIGQVIVYGALPDAINQLQAVRGWIGEVAARRVERLCSEEGLAFTGYGDLDGSVAMGAQRPDQLLTLLAECEASDLGQLFESRDQLGLAFRTRQSRAVQPAALALDYAALSDLAPVEDDQSTRNDVTVVRIGGSSARATVDNGPLSTQAPPNGVGRYDDQVELSLAADSQLADQANLRAVIGTIDEPRYPTLSVQLAGTAFAASAALIEDALDVDHGDRITVTGTPIWVPPEEIDQHTIGQVETLGVRTYQIDYVCQPATPIGAAGVYDDTVMRWALDSTTIAEDLDTTETAIDVTTAVLPYITTDAGDYPMNLVIGGEEITATGCTGAGPAQTFTGCTRSVNGVSKSHLTGAAVQIAAPFYWAL